MLKVLYSEIEKRAVSRPQGYLEDVLSHGKIDGDHVVFDSENYNKLIVKYRKIKIIKEPKETPSLAEMATNFAKAFSNWASEGFPIVSKQIFDERMEICSKCQFWSDDARGGLGKCNQPSCGCTKIKFWLATEQCPIGKWKKKNAVELEALD